jgi:two-component system chemotaxis sensor kinase CheA
MDIDRAALMQVFLSDSEEDLARMEETVLALEDHPDEVRTVDAIFRIAHTLKGNAAILALDVFAKTAHALEDVLDAVRTQRIPVTGDLTTLLLTAVDALRAMLGPLRAGEREDPTRHKNLLVDLAACAAAGKGEGGSPMAAEAGAPPPAAHDDAPPIFEGRT